MTRFITAVCVGLVVSPCGCQKSSSTTNPPASSTQLSFKPDYVISWPGSPSESNVIVPGASGEMKMYDARFTEKRPDGLLMLGVHVSEYPERALEQASAQELLEAYLHAFRKGDTSRKSVSFGPKKYPGLEVTRRSERLFQRILVVMAGRRMYSVDASVLKEELLALPEVDTFFKSFTIAD